MLTLESSSHFLVPARSILCTALILVILNMKDCRSSARHGPCWRSQSVSCSRCGGGLGPSVLTQQEGTLAVEDHHHAVLQLGGQVEGEARPRQPRLWWKDFTQHVVHDVVTGRGGRDKLVLLIYVIELWFCCCWKTMVARGGKAEWGHQVLFTATWRISRRLTFLPLVATSLRWKNQSRDLKSLPVPGRAEKYIEGGGGLPSLYF